MLFVENNIFQNILFSIGRICETFGMPYASNFIILKIFETSPFLIEDVHSYSAAYIQNFFERNKLKLIKVNSNETLLKEYEKAKKYFSKFLE